MYGDFTDQVFSPQILVAFISPLRGRPIVDRTGLSGSYDFSLEFTPETSNQLVPEDDAAPSIFTAVQEQLGLAIHGGQGTAAGDGR